MPRFTKMIRKISPFFAHAYRMLLEGVCVVITTERDKKRLRFQPRPNIDDLNRLDVITTEDMAAVEALIAGCFSVFFFPRGVCFFFWTQDHLWCIIFYTHVASNTTKLGKNRLIYPHSFD